MITKLIYLSKITREMITKLIYLSKLTREMVTKLIYLSKITREMVTKLIYLTNAWNESNESWILEKILFWFLERYKIFLSMTTFKHICHQITALILLIFVNANWFYHIFWRHLIKRIKSIKENTICANSLTYILVLETEKLFIMKTWLNKTALSKKKRKPVGPFQCVKT